MQSTIRQVKQQESINKICDAAFHLYFHKGIEGVSMRTIGKQLGVSQMMPYRYFKSKNDLLVEMRIRVIQQFSQYLGKLVIGKSSPEKKLFRIMFGYLHFSEVASDDYRFAFLMNQQLISKLNRDFVAVFKTGQENALEIHGNLISQILDEPVTSKKVRFLTRYLWISLHGLATANLDKMLFGTPEYEDIKIDYVRQIFTAIIEPSILAKLRKPTKYPEILPLVTSLD